MIFDSNLIGQFEKVICFLVLLTSKVIKATFKFSRVFEVFSQ
jgi:hypothetical protein